MQLLLLAAASLLLVLAPGASFAEGPSLARLKSRPFQEEYRDEAPVSGRVVVGVLLHGFPGEGLAVMPPASAAGRAVCVHVSSRDGRYVSRNTFVLPAEIPAAPVALEYPSSHEDFLRGLDPDGLAVRVSPGQCGDEEAELLYAAGARFGTGDPGGQRIAVLVNSARADTFVAVANDPEARRPRRCRSIQEGRRTAFDTVCELALGGLETGDAPLEVRIVRRHYDRMLPPARVRVALPGR